MKKKHFYGQKNLTFFGKKYVEKFNKLVDVSYSIGGDVIRTKINY